MILVIGFGILLLIFGACFATVFFAARRWGWQRTLLYLFFSISGRVITHFALSENDQAQQTLIPLLGAGVIVHFLPHIMRQRDLENSDLKSD